MKSLKEWREDRYLSQDELAKKANLTKSTINRLERGHHRPIFRTIRKLAAALEVEPQEIEF